LYKISVLYFLFITGICSSQQRESFLWPIDTQNTISGNYGELRTNHFHAGLDFTTKGRENLEVYAVEDGFVSRIRVSSYGYGKCLYITHPGGKVSVYAHLNSFNLKLTALVKQEQYNTESFEVELLPKPNLIKVVKGEVIGLSGNTGNSTGPHLHFELRDEKSETPLNPLEYYTTRDKTAPTIEQIAFYDVSDSTGPIYIRSFTTQQIKSASSLNLNQPLLLNHQLIGLAFSGYDKHFAKGYTLNIYSVRLFLDEVLIYSHRLYGIDFSDNRYVNEFADKIHGVKFQKCFIPTIYPLRLYGRSSNYGKIFIGDGLDHKLRIEAKDENGNENNLEFLIKYNPQINVAAKVIKPETFLDCRKDQSIKKNGIHLYIPARTLYYPTGIDIENNLETADYFKISPKNTNLASAVICGFKLPQKYSSTKDKLILRNEKQVYTPIIRSDSVYYAIRTFGKFQIEQDTDPPSIKLPKPAKNKKKIVYNALSFIIEDKQSGISKYSLRINGKWVLAEYDAKNDLLTYTFDEETPKGLVVLKVEAEDKVGNKNTFTYRLKR
jgi:hypothetical protein